MLNNLSLKDLTAIYEGTTYGMVSKSGNGWTVETPEDNYHFSNTVFFREFLEYQLLAAIETGDISVYDCISLTPVSEQDARQAAYIDGIEDNSVYIAF